MRLIGIDQIHGDEVLARSLFDIEGRRLLNSGALLKSSIVQKLHEKGISSVYIQDELSDGIEIEGLVSDETKSKAKMIIRDEMNRLSQKKDLDFSALNSIVDTLLYELLSKKNDVLNVKDIRMKDEMIFAHSLNVCIMAIALSSKLSLAVPKIKSIALGALMHDIGKSLTPHDISSKETLTEQEEQEFRKHPVLGYNMIKDVMDASPTTKICILMHHEHINGSGYPMGIVGDKIHYSARIVAICNEFDLAINDKVYKNVFQTTDAVEYLIGASGHIFDKSFVSEFIKIIPIYPEGTIVLLSNSFFAIVIKNNPINMTRPVVRAFYNPKTKIKYDRSHIIDLQYELSIKIIREIKVDTHEL